jgi:hypothetical protein
MTDEPSERFTLVFLTAPLASQRDCNGDRVMPVCKAVDDDGNAGKVGDVADSAAAFAARKLRWRSTL